LGSGEGGSGTIGSDDTGDGGSGETAPCDAVAGSDPQTWQPPNTGTYDSSSSLFVGVKLDGAIVDEGTIAAFVGESIRGLQAETTLVPDLPVAGEYANHAVWALAVSGHAEVDVGATVRFEFAPNDASTVLRTTYEWVANGVMGTVFAPFVLEGDAPCPA